MYVRVELICLFVDDVVLYVRYASLSHDMNIQHRSPFQLSQLPVHQSFRYWSPGGGAVATFMAC